MMCIAVRELDDRVFPVSCGTVFAGLAWLLELRC